MYSMLRRILFLIGLLSLVLVPVSQGGPLTINQESVRTNEVNYWGVIVGISDYQGETNDLPVSTSHLQILYNTLLESVNWQQDHIRLLLNEEATYDAVLSSLDWLVNQSDENDIVLFSFQGHGSSVDDVDGDESDALDEGIVAWEGLSAIITDDVLDSKFDAISCEGMFLVFHSCLSGGLIDSSINVTRFSSSFQQDIADDRRVIVMSSQNRGLALAFPSLTRQLAWGLKGGADGDDPGSADHGIITAEEAATFVKGRINKILVLLLLVFPPFIISIVISELIAKIVHGYWILPFPMIYDGYPDELPFFFV
jgi:hypothetical protein